MDKETTFSVLKLVASMALSVALSIIIKKKTEISANEDTREIGFVHNHTEAEPVNEDLVMGLVVRMDLKMSKGKSTAQCCHAATVLNTIVDEEILNQWKKNGQPKYIFKCQSQDDLHHVANEARKINVPSYIIRDAGRTQIPSGSETVLGIGPGK
ncbi:PTH2-domain-containing protein [Anaeromyces robustus]|uniref:peptidyl-tRNA hydrolase n=1 Tax=Anaeromyces robustus TaxID=1754192 RepID=A0A1Y1XP42_9FUNG|nr:PTH2-domain-containing protein [Anaeromyces robustus]|eukprot:ORX87501.1 PTH2-domain-containing protein [Anaeromyces robustus]